MSDPIKYAYPFGPTFLLGNGSIPITNNWDVDGTGLLFIDYVNKRIGVNNSSPAQTIDVTGRVDISAQTHLGGYIYPIESVLNIGHNNIYTNGNFDWPILFVDAGGVARTLLGLENSGNYGTILNATAGGDFIFLKGATTELMRLLNDGSLGVGVADPTAKLEINGGVRLNTATAKPTADSTSVGTMWATQGGAGVADVVEICLKSATDTYSWVNIATG